MTSPASDQQLGYMPTLGLGSALAIVVGCMIGSGVFIVSADVARAVQTPWQLLLVWAIAIVITVMGAYSYSLLSAAFPSAGGQYVFIRQAFGKLTAFLYGWALLFVIQSGSAAAVSVAFSKYLGLLIPQISESHLIINIAGFPLTSAKVAALFALVVLTFINTRGVKNAAWLQNVLTLLKVLTLVVLIALGFTAPFWVKGMLHQLTLIPAPTFSDITLLIPILPAVIIGPLFSSDAWNNLTFIAAEVKNPEKLVPKAMVLGTIAVGALYLLANLAYLNVLPLHAIGSAPYDRVAAEMMQILFGPVGAMIMASAILVSTFGCLNGMLMAGARVIVTMANDGLFFKPFTKLDPAFHTPNNALWAQAVWAALLAMSGSYTMLLDYIMFSSLVFYMVTISGVFVLFKQGQLALQGAVQKIVPALYVLSIALLTVLIAMAKPSTTLPGLLIILAGIPIYWIWTKAIQPAAVDEN